MQHLRTIFQGFGKKPAGMAQVRGISIATEIIQTRRQVEWTWKAWPIFRLKGVSPGTRISFHDRHRDLKTSYIYPREEDIHITNAIMDSIPLVDVDGRT